jgi:hypothetical protein
MFTAFRYHLQLLLVLFSADQDRNDSRSIFDSRGGPDKVWEEDRGFGFMAKPSNAVKFFQNFGNISTNAPKKSRFETDQEFELRKQLSYNQRFDSELKPSAHQRLGMVNTNLKSQSEFENSSRTTYSKAGLLDRPSALLSRLDNFPQPESQTQQSNAALSGLISTYANNQDLRSIMRSDTGPGLGERNGSNLENSRSYDPQLEQRNLPRYEYQEVGNISSAQPDRLVLQSTTTELRDSERLYSQSTLPAPRPSTTRNEVAHPDDFSGPTNSISEASLIRAEILMRRILNSMTGTNTRIVSNNQELDIALNLSKIMARDIRLYVRENEQDSNVREMIRKDAEEKIMASQMAASDERAYPVSAIQRDEATPRFPPNPGKHRSNWYCCNFTPLNTHLSEKVFNYAKKKPGINPIFFLLKHKFVGI